MLEYGSWSQRVLEFGSWSVESWRGGEILRVLEFGSWSDLHFNSYHMLDD